MSSPFRKILRRAKSRRRFGTASAAGMHRPPALYIECSRIQERGEVYGRELYYGRRGIPRQPEPAVQRRQGGAERPRRQPGPLQPDGTAAVGKASCLRRHFPRPGCGQSQHAGALRHAAHGLFRPDGAEHRL